MLLEVVDSTAVISSEAVRPSEYTRGREADDAGKNGNVLPWIATSNCKTNRHFSIQKHRFSGVIIHYLSTFNINFRQSWQFDCNSHTVPSSKVPTVMGSFRYTPRATAATSFAVDVTSASTLKPN